MTTAAGKDSRFLQEKTHCESIGNIVVCLHFLANQARGMGSPDIVKAIDDAIVNVMSVGVDAYQGHLRESMCDPHDGMKFVEDFCMVSDETIKFELREIAYKQAQGRRAG